MAKWVPPGRLERDYFNLLRPILNTIKRDSKKFTTSAQFTAYLTKLMQSKEFKAYSKKVAETAVGKMRMGTRAMWYSEKFMGKELAAALKKDLDGGLNSFYKKKISEHAELISSIPETLREHTATKISGLASGGSSQTSIINELRAYLPHLTESRLQLLARTGTSTTLTAITEARCRRVGLPCYLWRSTRDTRTRASHNHMKDVLIFWDNPPAPEELIGKKSEGHYHAAAIYNCRCYPRPVTNMDILEFPIQVYHQGSIRYMTKPQFEKVLETYRK